MVPRRGGVVSVSNHRHDKKDVKALGLVLGDRRTPFMPAKKELNHGIKGWFMLGSGAIFFDRDDADSRQWVYGKMKQTVNDDKHVHVFIEETSQNRGRQLGSISPSPVTLAMETELDSLILIGIGGTEGESSERIHLDFSMLSLQGLRSLVELKQSLNVSGRQLTIREAAMILARTEDVPLIADEELHLIANPEPGRRRGQRRVHKEVDPQTTAATRLHLYKIFTEQVLRKKLQDDIDIAYAQAT